MNRASSVSNGIRSSGGGGNVNGIEVMSFTNASKILNGSGAASPMMAVNGGHHHLSSNIPVQYSPLQETVRHVCYTFQDE